MTAFPGEPPLVALDANVLDLLARSDGGPARDLIHLLDERRLRLVLLPGIAAELSHPDAPPQLQSMLRAARPLERIRPTARQEIDRIRVRAILRGDGRPGKHDADAAHLSDAAEAGCSLFVTGDGKILRKRDTLRGALPDRLRITTLAELVAAVATDR